MNTSTFTPVEGLIGGALIGSSAAALLLLNGDILGASGITSSVLLYPKNNITDPALYWKLVLIVSFLLTSNLGFAGNYSEFTSGVSFLAYAIGGFFVGFGTNLGNGCTSGHGICGMTRLSYQSFVAVATFMTIGLATASIMSLPVLDAVTNELRTGDETLIPIPYVGIAIITTVALKAVLEPAFTTGENGSRTHDRKRFGAALAGILFAAGLVISGMVTSSKVFGFLDLSGLSDGTYDPTLVTVMGAGSLISFISYQFVEGYNVGPNTRCISSPLALDNNCQFSVPTNKIVDWKLILGASSFGFGWAIAGLCPGPALFHAAVGTSGTVMYWWPMFYVGSSLAQKLKSK